MLPQHSIDLTPEEYLAGTYDHTFTILQMAYYLQTGNNVALLPSYSPSAVKKTTT